MLQKSSVLGDLDKNFKIIEKSFKKCVSNDCDFFLTTELFLTGYPPQDLLLRNDFLEKVQFYKKKIKELTKNKSSILLLNIPEKTKNKVFNSLFLFKNGSIILTIDSNEVRTNSKNLSFAKNIIAVASIAITLGIDWQYLQDKILTFVPPKGRCKVLKYGISFACSEAL